MATTDPLMELRPPKMDMVTYLTYVEEHITKEKLPILYEVLEDKELTDSLGWDLVKTLIPLLPESQNCLVRIAKLGNPKEVILRVAESMRHIEFEPEEDIEKEENPENESQNKESNGTGPELPMPILQFQILIHMLALLHRRLRVKYPSRFLSSTLQAILATYSNVTSHHDEVTIEMVNFIKTFAGPKRPPFPPRRSSSGIRLSSMLAVSNDEPPPPLLPSEETEEDKIQARLVESFLTHVLDDYMSFLPHLEAVSGLSWCTRYMEHIKHPMLMTNKVSLTEQFAHSETLENRLTTVGQIMALALDLEIHSDDLVKTFMDPQPENEGDRGDEESYPTSAADIPLSKTGAFYLFTARKAMEVLNDGPKMPVLQIFPDHDKLMHTLAEDGTEALGMGTEALVDALLFHGFVALEANQIGQPNSNTQFFEYLQLTSALSAVLPNPTLRAQAHFLTTTVLRSHPKELAQLEFIRDTLEHCPFDNLKVSALSWIKGLTLDAAISFEKKEPTESLFATPGPLSTLGHSLFPDLTLVYPEDLSSNIQEHWENYQLDYSFYLATLSFIYLLMSHKQLSETLQIQKLLEENMVQTDFVNHLRITTKSFLAEAAPGGLLHDQVQDDPGFVPQHEVLIMSCNRIDEKAKELGWW